MCSAQHEEPVLVLAVLVLDVTPHFYNTHLHYTDSYETAGDGNEIAVEPFLARVYTSRRINPPVLL